MKVSLTENTKVTISIVLLVAVLIFLVTLTVTITGWKVGIESRVSALEGHVHQSRERQDLFHEEMGRVVTRQLQQDAIFAEIRTDLKWIRAALADHTD